MAAGHQTGLKPIWFFYNTRSFDGGVGPTDNERLRSFLSNLQNRIALYRRSSNFNNTFGLTRDNPYIGDPVGVLMFSHGGILTSSESVDLDFALQRYKTLRHFIFVGHDGYCYANAKAWPTPTMCHHPHHVANQSPCMIIGDVYRVFVPCIVHGKWV